LTPTAFDLVREDLVRVEEKLGDTSQVQYPLLAEVLANLLTSGGKRIRPTLVLLASSFHPCDRSTIVSLAASVEMLHTATLVHDDIIDHSLIRRGSPTLYAVWNDGATVLAGDYLFARAASMAAETDNVRVVTIFSDALMTICDGELREVFSRDHRVPSKEDYYRRIYGKTASLFAAATEAAGVLSGVPEEHVQALREYGHQLGMAFQIVDDVLDFIGDEDLLGKPVGSDLRQGTLTLPVLYYLQERPGDELLTRIWGDGKVRDEDVEEIIAMIRDSNAVPASLAEARHFADQANAALRLLPANEYRRAMLDLADFTVDRRM